MQQVTEADRIARLEAKVERLEVLLSGLWHRREEIATTIREVDYELYQEDLIYCNHVSLADRIARKLET